MSKIITLSEFIIDRQADFPYASGDLSRLLSDIGIAAKIVNQQVNKAGLGDILGAFGTTNIQGEVQQKLDVLSRAGLSKDNFHEAGTTHLTVRTRLVGLEGGAGVAGGRQRRRCMPS